MNFTAYYEFLKEYVSFQTLQDSVNFQAEAEKTIKRLGKVFLKNGFETQEYLINDIPLLVSKFVHNKNLPTGLIYTHYDMLMPEISSEWKNNPFNLYLGKEEIIGKGVAENKWPFCIYLTTILELIKEDKLWYNVIFLVDGGQYRVGTSLTEFLQQHKEELRSDFCFCSTDCGVGEEVTIETWQRGGINFDLVLSDVGESSQNTILEMSKLLAKCYTFNNAIAIPYFYYNVEKPQKTAEVKRYGTNLEYRTITKSTKPDYTILDPTLEITGIISLPTFEKSTLAPRKTIANLQLSIVNNQTANEIIAGLHQRLKLVVPKDLKTELIIHEAFNPSKFSLNNFYTQKALTLLKKLFNQSPEKKQKERWIKMLESLQTTICSTVIALPMAQSTDHLWEANECLKNEWIAMMADFLRHFFEK